MYKLNYSIWQGEHTNTTRNTDELGHGGVATGTLRGTVLDKGGSPGVLAAILVDDLESVLKELDKSQSGIPC